jgi:hypothetical protein
LQLFKIEKWFARAHAHQIRPARRRHSFAISIIQRDDNLFDNLSGREIAQQPKLGGKTKRALQRTAGLR